MLLDLDPAVFDAPDHEHVIDVLTMVAKQRHDWQPTMTDALRADRFVAKLTAGELRFPVLAEWARKAVEESAHRGPRRQAQVSVTVAELEWIAADLRQPAVLVVENRLGDGAFVRRVAAVLGEQRILDALDKAWLRFSNGGGTGDMPGLAADECKLFRVVVRVAVLFDSDRDGYGQPSDTDKKAELVRAANVPVHVLTWRMMENYLPFCIWEHHFPGKATVITQLRAMPPQQRGYLHLKHVFVGKKKPMPRPLIPDHVVLTEADFADLGPDVVAELRELLAMIHRIL